MEPTTCYALFRTYGLYGRPAGQQTPICALSHTIYQRSSQKPVNCLYPYLNGMKFNKCMGITYPIDKLSRDLSKPTVNLIHILNFVPYR